MTRVQLVTAERHFVTFVDVPPFRVLPTVITWGSRVFVCLGATDPRVKVVPQYLEAFAFSAPIEELPDTKPA